MLGQIVTGFIIILVGITLAGTISTQINNAMNCNSTNFIVLNQTPTGPTNSFGGGGTEHFGGYDGTVSHKSFISNADILTRDSNSSVFGCIWQDGSVGSNFNKGVLGLLPIFFVISLIIIAIRIMIKAIGFGEDI